jgi:uncharacterized protein
MTQSVLQKVGLLSLMLLWSATSHADNALKLVKAATSQVGTTVQYNGQYQKITYPNGDVPMHTGVCTDVIIRAYRKLGADLQVLVHEDMVKAWHAYPRTWALAAPDTNIDHRRVPNLAVFFRRHGQALPVSDDPKAYQPGDLVTWRLPSGVPHIGIVADQRAPSGVPLMVHNIGRGTQVEDMLFGFPITGHYRYQVKP